MRPLSGDALLTRNDIANNAATLENVRLWDHQPLLETFGQIQEIRTYYDFVSVDNDRYRINGTLRQVMLSARELELGQPAESNMGERAFDLHSWLRADARTGEPSDQRRTSGSVRARSASAIHGRFEDR